MSVKVRRILWIVLAVAALAAGASQVVFLARYPYFRKYAAIETAVSVYGISIA